MSYWVYYQCKHHIVYTDNFYTSLKLARYLLSTGTDHVGTIRRTSRGFPHIDIVCLGQVIHFKLANADSTVVCRYVDKRCAYSLLTVTAGNYVDIPKTRFNIVDRKLKPEMLLDYSKYIYLLPYMGGSGKELLRCRKEIKKIMAIYSI